MKRSPPPRRKKPLPARQSLAGRSTQLRRAKPERAAHEAVEGGEMKPQRRKRIKPRSDRRVVEDELWRDVKLAVKARDGNACRAAALVPEVACGGRLDPHHLWPTGSGGPRCDLANVWQVCRAMHDWIHAHPREAQRRGLLVPASAGYEGLREGVQLRLAWRRGDPTNPSWWTGSDGDTA